MTIETPTTPPTYNEGLWSEQEHELFLAAMTDFISWDDVSRRVGTRSRLQCRTHNQKIEKKIKNRQRAGVRAPPRKEHRLPSTPDMQTNVSSMAPSMTKQVGSPSAPELPITPPGVDAMEMTAWPFLDVAQMIGSEPMGFLTDETADRLLSEEELVEMLGRVDENEPEPKLYDVGGREPPPTA